jgi:hypothetical protein
MLLRRRWTPLLVALVPEIIYNALYFQVFHDFGFGNFLNAQPTTEYGSGGWLHFVPVIYYVGIPASILSLIGLIPMARMKSKALIFVPFIFYFILHTVIYRFGLFASGGYILFLLPMAPGFAVAAALGAEYAVEVLRLDAARKDIGEGKPHPRPLPVHGEGRVIKALQWQAFLPTKSMFSSGSSGQVIYIARQSLLRVVFGLTIAASVITGFQSRPWIIDPRAQAMSDAADWLRSNGLNHDRILSQDVMFEYYFLPDYTERVDNHPLTDYPSGTLAVWDSKYSDGAGLTFAELTAANGDWVEVTSFESGQGYIFQKR